MEKADVPFADEGGFPLEEPGGILGYERFAKADYIALEVMILVRSKADETREPGCGCSKPVGNYPSPAEVLAAILRGMEAAGL